MILFHLTLTGLMLAVIYYDFTRYLIPNMLVVALLALYPLMLIMSPVDVPWLWSLGLAAVVFLVGFGMFAMRWMGGGDVKLLAVCAFWAGAGGIGYFLILVGIFGGLLSIALLVLRPLLPQMLDLQKINLPRVLQPKQPVPYGLAIAFAFLLAQWQGKLAGLPV